METFTSPMEMMGGGAAAHRNRSKQHIGVAKHPKGDQASLHVAHCQVFTCICSSKRGLVGRFFSQVLLFLQAPTPWEHIKLHCISVCSLQHCTNLLLCCRRLKAFQQTKLLDASSCLMSTSRKDFDTRSTWAMLMQLKEADATVSSLRDEALEREDVIGQNYGTIQLLRQQVGELEKSKFVMGFHAKASVLLLE